MTRHPRAKLTEDEVRWAADQYAGGATLRAIAARLGVSAPTVGQIMAGRTWTHVTGGPVSPPRPWRVSDGERRVIIALRRQGRSQADIATAVGRSEWTVGNILRRHGLSVPPAPMNRKDHN